MYKTLFCFAFECIAHAAKEACMGVLLFICVLKEIEYQIFLCRKHLVCVFKQTVVKRYNPSSYFEEQGFKKDPKPNKNSLLSKEASRKFTEMSVSCFQYTVWNIQKSPLRISILSKTKFWTSLMVHNEWTLLQRKNCQMKISFGL